MNTRSLLIVDDNAGIRAIIRSMLSEWTDIIECGTGVDAVELYAASRPDWVTMDISMPGLDGLSATRRIRELDPNAKIVIVTDYADHRLRKLAADSGALAFVAKDDLTLLLEILQ